MIDGDTGLLIFHIITIDFSANPNTHNVKKVRKLHREFVGEMRKRTKKKFCCLQNKLYLCLLFHHEMKNVVVLDNFRELASRTRILTHF